MKVVAINGSYQGTKSNTYNMLKALLHGMEIAGAETEIATLANMNILPCRGCLTCLQVTPGKCPIQDDMPALVKKIANADLLIFGTPLYFWSMSGLMKVFIDRSLPAESLRKKKQKVLLVSPCGCPKVEDFQTLVATFKFITKMTERDYLGEILRTTAEMDDPEVKESYFELLKKAGSQIILSNKIDEELLEELHRPWISPEEWYELIKKHWNSTPHSSEAKETPQTTSPTDNC